MTIPTSNVSFSGLRSYTMDGPSTRTTALSDFYSGSQPLNKAYVHRWHTTVEFDMYREVFTQVADNLYATIDAAHSSFTSRTHMYTGGGWLNSGTVAINTIATMEYSNFSYTTIATTLTIPRSQACALSSLSVDRGLWFGGHTSASYDTLTTDIEGLVLSTNAAVNPTAVLAEARKDLSAIGGDGHEHSGTADLRRGYFGGGRNATTVSTQIDAYNFESGAASNPTHALSVARRGSAGVTNRRANTGYFCGGNTSATSGKYSSYSPNATTDKFDINTETIAASFTIVSSDDINCGISGNTCGYILHSYNGTGTYRLTYATNVSVSISATIGSGDVFSAVTRPYAGPLIYSSITYLTKDAHKLTNARSYIAGGVNNYTNYTTYSYTTLFRHDTETYALILSNPNSATLEGFARAWLAAVSSSTLGIWGGGATASTSGTTVNSLSHLVYSTETRGTSSISLSSARSKLAAYHSLTYGYFSGGTTDNASVVTNATDRVIFSSMTVDTAAASLGTAKSLINEGIASDTYGYLSGGSGNNTQIDRMVLATGAYSDIATTLAIGCGSAAGISKPSIIGAWGGGDNSAYYMQYLTYANDTSVSYNTTLQYSQVAATGGSGTMVGYFFGGNSSDPKSVTGTTRSGQSCKFKTLTTDIIYHAMTYPTAAAAAATHNTYTTLTPGTGGEYKYSISINSIRGRTTGSGYLAGGTVSSAVSSSIRKLNFQNERVSTISATLATARTNATGANSNIKGYCFGGSTTTGVSVTSQIDGLILTTDTAFDPATSLTVAAYVPSSVYSSEIAYINRGATVANWAGSLVVETFLFSNETISSSSNMPGTSLVARAGLNGQYKGFYVGGGVYDAYIGGIAGSNEVVGVTFHTTGVYTNPAAGLATAMYKPTGVSSIHCGYVAGGWLNAAGVSLDICGFYFSTETQNNIAYGLAASRAAITGTYSNSTGYFMGGDTSSYVCEALDFHTETIRVFNATSTYTDISPESRAVGWSSC